MYPYGLCSCTAISTAPTSMYISGAGAFAVLSSKLDLLGTCSATRQRAAASATPAVVAQVSPACLQLRLRDIDGPAQRSRSGPGIRHQTSPRAKLCRGTDVPTTSSRRKRGCDRVLGAPGFSKQNTSLCLWPRPCLVPADSPAVPVA